MITGPQPSIVTAGDIIAFWREAGPQRWYAKDDTFDQAIRDRFLTTYEAAAHGALSAWEATDKGALALIILLDQFPRNMFRDDARAFSTDRLACAVARRAIASGADRHIDMPLKQFFYLPLMHSEDLADQEACIALFAATGSEGNIEYAKIHADIIRRFGRFPHRNSVLGRATTPEEQAFLDAGGFRG